MIRLLHVRASPFARKARVLLEEAGRAAEVELVEGYAQDCNETDFDHAVCGIPFTNFDAATVESILESLMERLRPGGTLSFFEYWGIRRIRNVAARKKTRERLTAVDAVTDRFEDDYGVGEDLVLLNLPPAAAKHCMKPVDAPAS